MDIAITQELMTEFENAQHLADDGLEFWLARELQVLLGYTKWDNFVEVINKAKQSCDANKILESDHFADVGKTIDMPKGAQKEISDIMLTRYACYLIAQNGDPRKSQIAFAQSYFAVQTRKLELIQEKLEVFERLSARRKLSESESELSKVIFEQTKSDKNFALIRSKGDAALFGRTTQEMKDKRGVKPTQALADFMPTLLLKAKDFATEITIYNARNHNMKSEKIISNEHITNNATVRKTLIARGIIPEEINPEDDIKKVERKISTGAKKSLGSKRLKKK